ncbi:MAG: GNAT family N-acetyltransferase [Acutalibacteraceae bacterium]
MNYTIRPMQFDEYPLLEDFLYEAVFQRNSENLVPRTIINNPGLQIYIKEFGAMKDDYCLCAEVGGKIVGAVWVRNVGGYGSIDGLTPEFAISLYKDYRGHGIGTELMKQMLGLLKDEGYEKASLSVQKDNDALRMYQKVGFVIVSETKEEYIMVYYF